MVSFSCIKSWNFNAIFGANKLWIKLHLKCSGKENRDAETELRQAKVNVYARERERVPLVFNLPEWLKA